MERDEKKIIIRDADGQLLEYEVIQNFPFSSDTKRMGIILRGKEDGKIHFYLKGAEVVMRDKCSFA